MKMKSENCLYCHCAEQCVYIFNDKEPCPLIELEAEEGIPRVQYFRWIPCSEKLPKEQGQYYVSGEDKVWICDFLIFSNFKGGWCNNVSNPVVEAWMPLPEQYKGKEYFTKEDSEE